MRGLAACLTLVGLVSPGAALAHVYAPSCCYTDLEVKPRNWTSGGVGSSAYMEDLTWRRWGRSSALGTGTARLNDCKPDCAGGTSHYVSGRLRLSRIARCHGQPRRLAYTRATYRWRVPAGIEATMLGETPGWHQTTFDDRQVRCQLSATEKAGPPKGLPRLPVGTSLVIKPGALTTSDIDPQGTIYRGNRFSADGLQWRSWGVTARATGMVTSCDSDETCTTAPGTVELGGLGRYGCATGISSFEHYGRVRFQVEINGTKFESSWENDVLAC